MTETPQQIYILKRWCQTLDDCVILRAFRDRKDIEADIDRHVDTLCKLAKEDPEVFESETGYSPEVFTIEGSMEMTLTRLFHIEKVDLY